MDPVTILGIIAAAIPVLLALFKAYQAICGGGKVIPETENKIGGSNATDTLQDARDNIIIDDLGLRDKPSTDDSGK